MSDVPPPGNEPPSEPPHPPVGQYSTPPPSQNVAYPRDAMYFQGTPERLQALADAYFGLNWVFVVNVVLLLGSRFLTAWILFGGGPPVLDDSALLLNFVIPMGVTGLAVLAMAHKPSQRAAFGMGWAPNGGLLMAILLALQSWLCCGLIGIVIAQHLLVAEMNKYSVMGTVFGGIKKRNVEAVIERMRQMQPPQGPEQTNII